MRIDAATASGERRSETARTGAPARARTVLMPTVRSNVLLPDMLEPGHDQHLALTVEGDVVAHGPRNGEQGMSDAARLEQRAGLHELRIGIGRVLERVRSRG